jgi:hypothetical protein
MKATIKNLNAAIAARYPKLDIELVRGEGYFYFAGIDGYEVESIYICYLNQATREHWLDHVFGNIDAMIAKRDEEQDDEPVHKTASGAIVLGNWK